MLYYTLPMSTKDSFHRAFDTILQTSESLIITSHLSPDDDAIGSMLALREVITTQYPSLSIRMVISGKPEHRWKSFTHFKDVQFVDDITNVVQPADTLIMVDGGQYSRFSKNPEKLKSLARHSIIIDHHASISDPVSIAYIDAKKPATAEIIFDLFDTPNIRTRDFAEAVLLGILGDTGMFAYIKPFQLHTLSVAQTLLQYLDIEVQSFYLRYSAIPQEVYKGIAKYMEHSTFHDISPVPPFHTSFITANDITSLDIAPELIDIAKEEFISAYIRSISGYQWGFVCYPTEQSEYKVSMRSLPNVMNVRAIVEGMNIGGGHDYAAGGTIPAGVVSSVEDAVLYIKGWVVNNYKNLPKAK